MAGPEAQGADEAPGRGGFWRFWTTLPGVLTGLAALVTALVGLVALLSGPDDDAGAGVAAPPPVASTRAPDTAPTPAGPAPVPSTPSSSAAAPSSTAAGARVLTEGQLDLRVDEWADLTTGAVASYRTMGSELGLINTGSYALNPAIAQRFAVPGGGELDRDACVRALQQRREGPLPLQGLSEGATVCLVTYAENIAGLRITALPAVGSPRISFAYVVWA